MLYEKSNISEAASQGFFFISELEREINVALSSQVAENKSIKEWCWSENIRVDLQTRKAGCDCKETPVPPEKYQFPWAPRPQEGQEQERAFTNTMMCLCICSIIILDEHLVYLYQERLILMSLEPNTLKQTIILGVFFLLLVTTYISFSNIITFIFEHNS